MKKPSRVPPPPPPPPRSLRLSCCSLAHSTRTTCGYFYNPPAASECSEALSFRSVPHNPIQRSFSPSFNSYESARSESGVYYPTSIPSTASSRNCIRQCCTTIPTPCCTECTLSSRSQQSNDSPRPVSRPVFRPAPRPVPRERTFRPRQSISPEPICKIDKKDRSRLSYRCESLSYRRHIEQHIEKIFKYLRDRQSRLIECENGAKALKIKDRAHVEKMQSLKETHYLRSLRARLGPNDFEILKLLGSGYIGKVSLVRSRDAYFSGQHALYAMKKLRKEQVYQQNHMAHVIAERDILAEANNEWIVKLFYSFQDENYLYFILEYVPGGDMMNLLCKINVFPKEWAQFYIAEISLALQFVHDMKFIHRDIKPDNILIDATGHIKLTDFGLCRGNRWTHDLSYYRDDTYYAQGENNNNGHDEHPTITKALTRRELEHSTRKRALSLVGSPNYIAPEVLRQVNLGSNEELCDWWSVGVILYEMVIGYCPFIDLESLKANKYEPMRDSPEQIQERIKNWRLHLAFPSPEDPKSPPPMASNDGHMRYIDDDERALIQGWLCEPKDRLCKGGIRDIQGHPFFNGIDWQRIRSMPAPYVPTLSHELDTSHFENSLPTHGHDATILPISKINRQMNDFTFVGFRNNT